MSDMMNPVMQAQDEIAETLRAVPWFAQNHVEIIEQNKADLAFLLQKSIAAIKGVSMVIGCDSVTNQQSLLEMYVTITAIENVPLNRVGEEWGSAIDAVQAAIQVLDGPWWHFEELTHDTPAERVLAATATMRGLINRDFFYNRQQSTDNENSNQ